MKVRAKFYVAKSSELGYGGKRQDISKGTTIKAGTPDPVTGKTLSIDKAVYTSTGVPIREITMFAMYGGTPENDSFASATPTGSITFTLNNERCAEEFKPGQEYYVEFTPVSEVKEV
jgi:hypothetical protein